MYKVTGRKVGLMCGKDTWTKHLHRSYEKRLNNKKVRRNLNKFDYEKTL